MCIRDRRNVESILNRDLEFSTRKRKDLEAIILISSSEAAKRILPALKFNLLQDIAVFNMPNHYDSWNDSSSPSDLENSQGLEHPILLNKMNFDDDSFNFLNSKEKVIYSLGFDALGVINKRSHFGFLGQHSIENGKVSLSPVEDLDIPDDAVGESKGKSSDRKPSRPRNGNRNNRGGKKPETNNKSSNRKRVSFEDDFEKGL